MSAPNPTTPEGGRVLVVDDDGRNRELLHELLVARGYSVIEAENGFVALECAVRDAPHAILLDVMMPGMDGFEVCRRLKADPATSPIPILLVTALQERDDRLRGIEAGANDFLTKPIDTREVMLRTRNAIYSKQLYDRVQSDFERLRDLERLRDNLTHMIVHDMRSPLMGISGHLELVSSTLEGRIPAEDMESIREAHLNSRKLIDMVSSLLDVSKLEAGQMPMHKETCDLGEVARESVDLLDGLLRRSPAQIDVAAPATASCDRALILRVISNLLGNAAKYAPTESRIHVVVAPAAGAVKVSVTDQGKGIPPEFQQKIFDKFGQVDSTVKHSTGLGLTFCKLAIEAHGGKIGVESEPGRGCTFWFTLPTP